ncbi:unnamed protein product [Blepharisma stoltei]|uniref:Uncharacterized protein n=1 Tax=Blepharisma stoltei TaxID=1481888 RepID=A0AAU9J0T1_9CILI|nr:unnamed protein product [Blepharisma stoltei]
MTDRSGWDAERVVQNSKEILMNKFQEVANVEQAVMMEIMVKDAERESVLRDMILEVEILERENRILTMENKSLKEMMENCKNSSL